MSTAVLAECAIWKPLQSGSGKVSGLTPDLRRILSAKWSSHACSRAAEFLLHGSAFNGIDSKHVVLAKRARGSRQVTIPHGIGTLRKPLDREARGSGLRPSRGASCGRRLTAIWSTEPTRLLIPSLRRSLHITALQDSATSGVHVIMK